MSQPSQAAKKNKQLKEAVVDKAKEKEQAGDIFLKQKQNISMLKKLQGEIEKKMTGQPKN